MPYKIRCIEAREVIDSRGNPTVEAEVFLTDESYGRAIVPSGASTGIHEALELKDNDKSRFLGRGVLTAVRNIKERIEPVVTHRDVSHISELDGWMLELDGTPQKQTLGANSILAVSMAFAHAVSASRKQPLFIVINEMMGGLRMSLPIPLMNIINGGLHADNGLEFQEFMIVPHGFETFTYALQAGCEIFQHLKRLLGTRHESTSVGDEGGFAPRLENNERVIQTIIEAIYLAGYAPGKQVSIALDVAASSFLVDNQYRLNIAGTALLDANELIGLYEDLCRKYPIVSIEDGLGEEDWNGWKDLTARLGSRVQLVGDDLFVTQLKHLQKGIEQRAGNAILIKVNQVGSLSETFATMQLAQDNHFRKIVSHRSGETEDTTIAHLAVGSGAGQIKTGSLSRGERTAKYNELLRIESYAQHRGITLDFKSPFTP